MLRVSCSHTIAPTTSQGQGPAVGPSLSRGISQIWRIAGVHLSLRSEDGSIDEQLGHLAIDDHLADLQLDSDGAKEGFEDAEGADEHEDAYAEYAEYDEYAEHEVEGAVYGATKQCTAGTPTAPCLT